MGNSAWAILWIRYRYVIYIIPALCSIPIAIYGIKTYVNPENEIWVATAYLGGFFGIVLLSLPLNIYQGALKKWFIIEVPGRLFRFELPIQNLGELDHTPLDPIFVSGVLVERTETIIPLEREEDFSDVLPEIGRTRFVALRYHLTYSERFDFQEEIVYHHGTPVHSRNAEVIQAYLVGVNTALHRGEYPPIPVFEVTSTRFGDKKWLKYVSILDAAFARRVELREDQKKQVAEIEEQMAAMAKEVKKIDGKEGPPPEAPEELEAR